MGGWLLRSGKESEELFDFIIAYVAVALITAISSSYEEDVLLTLLVLIPILLLTLIYKRAKYRKMGKQLIKLSKTYSALPSIRITFAIVLIFVAFIVTVSYFGNRRVGIPWIIFLILQITYQKYTETVVREGLMDNGLCASGRLIDWGTIQSYKWTAPSARQDYFTLKTEYSKFYSFHVAYLKIVGEQKAEVDALMKKMVRT
ncbi:hypothetical protein CEB3_c26670 [Peptococcaceae bacterium CEB3]|nr:hypothetical protein CEB3_c26670 [Peptococcaceae bacterium CEB3]